jgi:predicted AlkP superfamily pyrophosphatase or phosphodiesterase
VVLVSVDGLRWDDPQRIGGESFAKLQREGATAGGLVPPFPASTFPAHATLATGVHPDRHGIVANRFLDSERGAFRKEADASWLLSEPIWVTAERQGVTAAVSHWVFSGEAWRGTAASIREPFSPGVSDSRKIDAIIEWLRLPIEERPRLIMSYLRGVDGTAHREGPASAAVDDAVRAVDRLVGRLLDAAARSGGEIALIIVSDHGMADATRVRRLDRLLSGEAGRVRSFSSGGSANLYCPDEVACRAAAERLAAISALSVFAIDDLPPELHYRLPGRTGDLVVVAPPGDLLLARAPRGGSIGRGTHGYHPEERDMWGVFFAWGAGVRAGARLERMRAVDVAPLICRLVGIRPPDGIDGRLRHEIVADEAAPSDPMDREVSAWSLPEREDRRQPRTLPSATGQRARAPDGAESL